MVAPGVFVSTLLTAGFRKASQVVLDNSQAGQAEHLNTAVAPPTGNIPYTLPTERTFLLNVPEAYEHGEKHPLVLSFHGGEYSNMSLRQALES